MRQKIYGILIAVFLLVFLVSGGMLLKYYLESTEAKKTYDNLADMVEQVRKEQPTVPLETDGEGHILLPEVTEPELVEVTHPETGETVMVLPEYAQVFLLNTDMVGWIYLDGTRINYPVMQRKDSKDYYLQRDFYGKSSKDGSIYVREECDVLAPSDNLTLYGHRMNSGAMFADLLNYKEKAFWENNRYIHFDTLQQRQIYEVIAAFKIAATADNGFQYHTYVDFADEAEFYKYVEQCKDRAFYDTGVTAHYGEKLLTLSTCEKGNSNMRIVVVAKKIS